MSAAYYIVLSSDNPPFDSHVSGKALAKYAERVNRLFSDLQIKSLDDLISHSQDEIEELMEMSEMNEPPPWYTGEIWFPALDGVEWIKDARNSVVNSDLAEDAKSDVIADLDEFIGVLQLALTHDLKWHLAIDY